MIELITIGLPTHNGAKTLEDAIKSLLQQTYRDFKIIISDNNSDDETMFICEKFSQLDSRVIYVRQEENIGALGNFKYVLERADTKYFMWACDDDLWDPSFVAKLIQQLEISDEYAFAVSLWQVVSRRYPFIRRLFIARMDFISNKDPKIRVKNYSSLPFNSFKDNLTFGVWRTWQLKEIMKISEMGVKYFSIGGVFNEYTLALCRGVVVNEVLFYKRYLSLPPGSFIYHVFKPLKLALNFFTGNSKGRRYPKYAGSDFEGDIRLVLRDARMEDAFIEEIVEISRVIWP